MSHSSSHFLTLDATKKPTVRKGVNFQSYIPPVLPGTKQPAPRANQLNKVHAAIDTRVGAIMERVSKTLPDMGPFNVIAQELAVEYLESQARSSSADSESGSKPSTYWDAFEDSLDMIIKQEDNHEGNGRSASFTLDALRSLLSRLEAWNERAIKATLGTGQVLSTEVDDLLEEARIIEQRVEMPVEILNKLRVLQKVGESFANKVRSKLTLKGKEKVPLRVLTELMKEAETLPIETEEVRFFRNQRGRIQALCHSAQKASRDKSLEKSKDVTIEAAEIRAILPDLEFVQAQVSMAEWVQKAMSKTDKRGSVPLQTIEQLFEDPSAALIKPEECEIMQVLQRAMNEGRAWQASANKVLAGLPTPQSKAIKQMPTVEVLQSLLDDHSKLSKVCVPTLSSNIEGLLRRAKAWMKKQERTLSGTWSLVDAKSLLEEGKQISAQVDLNPQFGELVREVSKAEDWCSRARIILNSLALTDIDQLEPLVNTSFKAPTMDVVMEEAEGPLTKRARRNGSATSPTLNDPNFASRLSLSNKEVQALKNYESSLADLTATLQGAEPWLVPLLMSEKLPKQADLLNLRESLGIVRDLILEEDVNQLCDGAIKWHDRAETVLNSPFPRPAGVLRSLASLVHELAGNPMRYDHWKDIIEAAKLESWAHQVRYVEVPISESSLETLVSSCPFALEFDKEISELKENMQTESRIASMLTDWQDDWMRQVLGLERRPLNGARGDEALTVKYAQACKVVYEKHCGDLLVPRRARKDAEAFLDSLKNAKLVSFSSLITRVETALNRNSALEQTSEHLATRFLANFNGTADDSLFHDLLVLLESVEKADLQVSHFDKAFTPMVAQLLQYQSTVRSLFKWDHDESVQEAGYRPSLQQVEQLWNQMISDAANKFKLSQNFLQSVAYIQTAVTIVTNAHAWRSNLGELTKLLRIFDQSNTDRVSIAVVRKHLNLLSKFPVIVPFNDIISDQELEGMEAWETQTVQLYQRTKQGSKTTRATLAEAEEVLKNAPPPLCVNSADFATLASHVSVAQKIRNDSFAMIAASHSYRVRSAGEVQEPTTGSLVNEISNFIKESKSTVIDPGVTSFLETEMRVSRIETHLRAVLLRPHVVPLELIDRYLEKVAEFANGVENSWDEMVHERKQFLAGVEFAPSKQLFVGCQDLIKRTVKWRTLAHAFISKLPAGVLDSVPANAPSKKSVAALTLMPAEPSADMGQLELALGTALGAPPTAAGEKILDIVIRNLEKDLGTLSYDEWGKNSPIVEYAYPLPLYQLPASSAPGTPNPAPVSKRKTNAATAAQAGPPPENPLLIKGLSPLHQLLFQIPWTRAGMGYLSPVNEVLMRKPTDWVQAERQKFCQRLAQPGVPLRDALELLVEHKRNSLLQVGDYVKMRSSAAVALRTVRTCMHRFPFLAARNKHEETDVAVELWERILQPGSSSGGGMETETPTPATGKESKESEEVELVGLLLQLEGLAFQVPTKYRLLMLMLDMYDWRVKAQSVCHHMGWNARPRPWTADERALSRWASTSPPTDIFSQKSVAPAPTATDPLCIHAVPAPPPKEFVLCAMHMSFYYVVECCRHFIRVMSDMCELCCNVTTTDQEDVFWISCDVCDRWFHPRCAGVNQGASAFTCPQCLVSNPNASSEKRRVAMNILTQLPPKKFNLMDANARSQEASRLLGDAKQQLIIVTVNPVEVGIFKRIVGPAINQ
jgi:hypothetical protein